MWARYPCNCAVVVHVGEMNHVQALLRASILFAKLEYYPRLEKGVAVGRTLFTLWTRAFAELTKSRVGALTKQDAGAQEKVQQSVTIELITSDRKLKASREGSTGRIYGT